MKRFIMSLGVGAGLVLGAAPALAHHPITTSEIANEAVIATKIDRYAVTNTRIRNGAVTSAKLASALTIDTLTISTEAGATVTRNVAGSFQPIWADLTVGNTFGTGTAAESDFGAAMMGHIDGTNTLASGNNYLAGLIGAYSITSQESSYPKGGVLGLVGVNEPIAAAEQPDGAVVAVLDGDSGLIRGGAAFKMMNNNSTVGSGFDYGLDLFGAAHDGYLTNADMIDTADVRLQNGETISNETDGTIDFGAADLVTTGDVDFGGAATLQVPNGAGLAATACDAAGEIGNIYVATSTAGAMTDGVAYICTEDADQNGTADDTGWAEISNLVAS